MKQFILLLLVSTLFISCDKEEKFNRMSVTSIVYPNTDPECPEGGHRISEGGDYNDNGYLEYDEVAYSYLICGVQGEQGEQGIKGNDGADGTDGTDGQTGEQGIQGIQGEQGEQGVQGETGATGATGDTGAQGEQGIQGEQGEDGIDGIDGTNGTNGTNGVDGTDGEDSDDDGGGGLPDDEARITVCHNGRSKVIRGSELQAHLGHGDVLGECED